MGDENKCIQVRIRINGEVLDEHLLMMQEEMLAWKNVAVEQIRETAKQRLQQKDVELHRLVYEDEEGDLCTFTPDTLEDALSFATRAGTQPDSIWLLEVRAVITPSDPSNNMKSVGVSGSAQETHAAEVCMDSQKCFGSAHAMSEMVQHVLERLSGGPGFLHTLPKLATIALHIVNSEQRDELYPLLEPLLALQEGIVGPESFPPMLLSMMEVLASLPLEDKMRLATRFKDDAMPILLECRVEKCKETESDKEKKENNDGPIEPKEGDRGLEVHVHVTCDGCNRHPIIGPRHTSLDYPDYDLCDQCFRKEAGRNATRWEQKSSGVLCDVVGSYYAPVIPGRMAHHNTVCDGCEMSPLLGRRYRCTTLENFDLCEACHTRREEIVPDQEFEELICTSMVPAVLPECDEPAVAPPECGTTDAPVIQSQLQDMEARLMARMRCMQDQCEAKLRDAQKSQRAIESLLTHSDSHVRSVVQAAVREAQQETSEDVDATRKDEESLVVDTETESQITIQEEFPDLIAIETIAPVMPKPSAVAMSSSELMLGVEAQEDECARGDVTEEFAGVLSSAGVNHAYRMGRAVLPVGTASPVPACAKVCIMNNGDVAWPETTVVQLVHGDSLGLPQMQLGALQSGEAAEVIMDLLLPVNDAPASTRSAWVLVDTATGASFGPLLFFEATWINR